MVHKSKGEKLFVEISIKMFYEIVDEVFSDPFWKQSPEYRFNKIKNAFSIYAELLNYKPLREVAEQFNSIRGPGIGRLLGVQLFKVIRHLLLHFPIYNSWEEVWFNKSLVTWERVGLIHNFFKKHSGEGGIRYTYRESKTNEDVSVNIWLPKGYLQDEKIYLSEIMPEETGMKICISLMCDVVDPFKFVMIAESLED